MRKTMWSHSLGESISTLQQKLITIKVVMINQTCMKTLRVAQNSDLNKEIKCDTYELS